MSWWNAIGNVGQGLIAGIDAATDRATATIDRTILSVVQEAAGKLDQVIDRSAAALERDVVPVVHEIAGKIDQAMDRTLHRVASQPGDQGATQADREAETEGPTLAERVRAIDRRYQEFMVYRIDPLFGQARNQHLQELGSLEISERELMLNRQIAFSGVALVSLIGGRLLAPATLFITVPASFTLTLPVFHNAITSVQKQRRITYHLVSAINVTAIWLGGFYIPALAVAMAFYMGEKLLMVTEDRSQKGLIAVFSQQPRLVTVLEEGRENERPLKEIATGAIVVVRAGGFMPVDGHVVEGLALIDQHMLTGEAKPAEKAPGDLVYASTVVLAGKVHVQVSCAGDETVAAKIGDVLNQTASYQLSLQSKGSKICHDFALPTLILSFLALVSQGPESGLAILNSSFGTSVRMSSPVTMLNLLNIASQNAILLKDGRSLDLLSEVDTVVFDKTGTLTLVRPDVARVIPLAGFDSDGLLALAAAAERGQSHPIALAIVAEAEDRGIIIPEIDHASYEVGYGIRVKIGALNVQIGSDRFVTLEGMTLPPELVAAQTSSHQRGNSLVLVAVDGCLAGAIELQPTIRPEAEEVLHALRERGLDIVVISGDQEEPTRNLSERLGMTRYFANILPEGKAKLVQQLQEEGHVVCFVGDGINDSIALKRSNVSVSLRGATTVATDAAQIVLMQESLCQLPFIFELGDDMERSMRLGLIAGVVPGVISVAGVFLLGWGYLSAIGLSMVGLGTGLGAAVYPLYKYRHLSAGSQSKVLGDVGLDNDSSPEQADKSDEPATDAVGNPEIAFAEAEAKTTEATTTSVEGSATATTHVQTSAEEQPSADAENKVSNRSNRTRTAKRARRSSVPPAD
jgi:heavy metal translocating P-type ATPase